MNPDSDEKLVGSVIFSEFGGFDKIKVIKHLLNPNKCGPFDVEVEVKYCGVNFADLYMRQGLIPDLPLPCILGLECMGIVKEVGNKVMSFEKGQRVLCYNGNGGLYRETVIVNEKNCFPVPDYIEDEIAVSLPANYLTAYFCLFEIGNIKKDQNILIHSCAGGVGWAATQLARTVENVTIVGTASPHKFEEAKKNGVRFLIRSDNYINDLKAHPNLNTMKFDIIIDPIGGSNIAVSQSLLDHLGKLILIGANQIVTGEEKFSALSLFKLWWKTKSITVTDLIMNNNVVAGLHLARLMDAQPEKVQRAMNYIFDLYKSRVIKPRIDSSFSFSQIEKAMKKLANRENIGKVIIKV